MTDTKARMPAGSQPAPRADDPLAELARLIGQDDPFRDFRAEPQARPAPVAADPRRPVFPDVKAPVDPRIALGDSRYAARAPERPRLAPVEMSQPPMPAPPRPPAPVEPSLDRLSRPSQVLAAAPPRQAPMAPAVAPQAVARPAAAPQPAVPPAVASERVVSRPPPVAPPPASEPGQRRYEDVDAFDRDFDPQPHELDPYYSDDGHMPPHGEDLSEEPPRTRSRTGLLVLVGVVGLTVIGAGGVFGYRALFGAGGKPPTIRADAGPNKVAPASSGQDSSGQKLIYDRVGNPGGGGDARVVSREEQPVELGKPRVALAPTNDPQSASEPRRVRTMTVRGDGTVVPNAAPPQAPQAAPTPTRVATQSIPMPAQPAPAAARPAPPQPAPQPVQPRLASAPQPAPAAPATPAASGGSGFFVQVSAVRSESEAQSSLRSAQGKYGDAVSGVRTTVRRADVNGVTYYRAQFGPFASREAAAGACSRIQSGGGSCIVQRN